MDVDVQQFLSLGLPILVPAVVLLLLLGAALIWYVRRTKKRQRARRQRRRERAAARRCQSSGSSPAHTSPAPPTRSAAPTPSLNINVSISRTPSRSGGYRGYSNGTPGAVPQDPPTYEEALRSGPPAIAAATVDIVNSGRRAVTLQRHPSDPPPPYDLGTSPNHPWSLPLHNLPSHRATPISIISTGGIAPCGPYPNSYHSTLSSSYSADNEVHQRSFSCPTPQTRSSSRGGALDEELEADSSLLLHQRSASHDPSSASAAAYDPESIRNVAQHLYSESRRHCRGLTRARSRSGLALSLEDLASVGLTEERERKRRKREAREREQRQTDAALRPQQTQQIQSVDGTNTPQMIHRLLGERFPGVHYGSVTPSRIGGRYGSIANLATPQDTQRVHYDSENSVERRFARRFRRHEARRGRYHSTVSLDTGRYIEEDSGLNRQTSVCNDIPQQLQQQHQPQQQHRPQQQRQHQQQQQQQRQQQQGERHQNVQNTEHCQMAQQHEQHQQQTQQQQHQQLQQQLSDTSLKRRQLISLGKTPSFISRILSRNSIPRNTNSCDEQLLKPSNLLYTYRFTEDGGLEVGVVGENGEISTDSITPAEQDIVVHENSNGEVIYSLDSSVTSSVQNTSSSNPYFFNVGHTAEGIELRVDTDNRTVLYSRDLDGGGLSGIYV